MKTPFMIAEIGINANGSVKTAQELIFKAKESGADAVKFQKRNIDIVYTQEFLNGYRESPWGNKQRDQKEGIEFDHAEYKDIDWFCKQMNIPWFASAWDEQSQLLLRTFNMPYNKIASAMITHSSFLKLVAVEKKHTFISTGMTENVAQITKAVEIFESHKCPYTLMHCVSVYPCPNEYCNIQMINDLFSRYSSGEYFRGVGYSGHERGHIPSVLAVGLGATAIERYITLDRTMYGSDQAASLEPGQFQRLCRDCRNVGSMLKSTDHSEGLIKAEAEVAKKLRYWENDNEL